MKRKVLLSSWLDSHIDYPNHILHLDDPWERQMERRRPSTHSQVDHLLCIFRSSLRTLKSVPYLVPYRVWWKGETPNTTCGSCCFALRWFFSTFILLRLKVWFCCYRVWSKQSLSFSFFFTDRVWIILLVCLDGWMQCWMRKERKKEREVFVSEFSKEEELSSFKSHDFNPMVSWEEWMGTEMKRM